MPHSQYIPGNEPVELRVSLAYRWAAMSALPIVALFLFPVPDTPIWGALYVVNGALIAWALVGAWWNWRQAHAA